MALPPDDKTAKKHWQAQDASIDLPLHSRDPGVVQVASPTEVHEIVARELDGERVAVFKERTNGELEDPVARSTNLIRSVTQKGVTSEQFYKRVETTEDLLLHLCLFGNMEDGMKAVNLHKLSKLLWDKQKEVLKQNNLRQNLEEKRVRNALELDRKLDKLRARGMIQDAKVIPKDGDA